MGGRMKGENQGGESHSEEALEKRGSERQREGKRLRVC